MMMCQNTDFFVFLDPERLLLEQSNNWSALGCGFSFRVVPKQTTFVFLGVFFVKTVIQLCFCVCSSALGLYQE